MPAELARRAAGFDAMFGALDIVEVARALGRDIDTVARVYFGLAGELDFPWLRTRVGMLAADDHWQARAKAALRDDLAAILRSLTADALQGEGTIAAWKARNARATSDSARSSPTCMPPKRPTSPCFRSRCASCATWHARCQLSRIFALKQQSTTSRRLCETYSRSARGAGIRRDGRGQKEP